MTYSLNQPVWLRYARDRSGNAGKITCICEQDGGGFLYDVSTPASLFTGIDAESLSPTPSITREMDLILRVLNAALAADQLAITRLLDHHEPCNDALADHPTVQVRVPTHHDGSPYPPEVGALGLINGIVEPLTGQRVSAVYDDSGSEAIEFRVYQKEIV